MRSAIALLAVLFAASAATAGPTCAEWQRLNDAQRDARIQGMIDGHMDSNIGKKYTNENRVAMRMCLQRVSGEIRAQFDGICYEQRNVGMRELDELFDTYFLSCVQ